MKYQIEIEAILIGNTLSEKVAPAQLQNRVQQLITAGRFSDAKWAAIEASEPERAALLDMVYEAEHRAIMAEYAALTRARAA